MDKNRIQFRFELPCTSKRLADLQLLLDCHSFSDAHGAGVDVTTLHPGVHTLSTLGLPFAAVEKFLAFGRAADCSVAIHGTHYEGWKRSEFGLLSFYDAEKRRAVRNFPARAGIFSRQKTEVGAWPKLLVDPSTALPACLCDLTSADA